MHYKAGVDERDVLGLKTHTFYNEKGDIEAVIATGDGSTIVAIPKGAISLDNRMGDDEFTCLKNCRDIADLEKRLNCILLCPVSTNYRVFIA